MMYLGQDAVGINIPQNVQISSGTFVGNDAYTYEVACPFEPDAYIVWTDEITSNPGKAGLLSVTEMRATRMLSYRYTTDSAANPGLGGSASYSGKYYSSTYDNGTMVVCAGRKESFRFYDGITYKYVFIKEMGSDT